MNPYSHEIEMYMPVCEWLESVVGSRIRDATVAVYDTHSHPLNRFVSSNGLESYFDSDVWQTFEIRVDVTAFVRSSKVSGVAFVECKLKPVTLRDFSQLLGYSRIANPLFSFLISPTGIGSNLRSIVQTYGRGDILQYAWPEGENPRTMTLGKWDAKTNSLDARSTVSI